MNQICTRLRLRTVSILAFSLLVLSSCQGSSNKDKVKDDSAIRLGQKQELEQTTSYDAGPSVSADGRWVVFTSGRSKVMRAYKYDAAATSPKAQRITSTADKLSEERDAVVSPNGLWAYFFGITTSDGSTIMRTYGRKLDGSGSSQQISSATDENLFELALHPNGEALAYTARSVNDPSQSNIYVTTISPAAGFTATAPLQATTDDEYASRPVWLADAAGGPYRLVYWRVSSFKEELIVKTFALNGTQLAETASATYSDLTDVHLDDQVKLVATSDGLAAAIYNPASGTLHRGRVAPELYKGLKSRTTYGAVNVPIAITDSDSMSKLKSYGLGVRAIAQASAGLRVQVEQFAYMCEQDKALFANALTLSSGTDIALLNLGLDKNAKVTATSTKICTTGTNFKKFDYQIFDVALNQDATATDYTISYTTLVTGNHEVRLIKHNGDTTKFVNVSAN